MCHYFYISFTCHSLGGTTSIENTNFKHNISTSNIKWTRKNISHKRSRWKYCKTWWGGSRQHFLFCHVMEKMLQGSKSFPCVCKNTRDIIYRNIQGSHYIWYFWNTGKVFSKKLLHPASASAASQYGDGKQGSKCMFTETMWAAIVAWWLYGHHVVWLWWVSVSFLL